MAIEVEALYRRYGPMVLRRCRRLLNNEEQAADAMHDVFVQLLRYQKRLDDTAPSSLLYRIATHVCLNRLRSKKRRPEDPADDLLLELAHQSSDVDRLEARTWLARFFGDVPPSTAEIAVLHWVDGLTLEEVANESGLSVSGVRKRLRVLKGRLGTAAPQEEI